MDRQGFAAKVIKRLLTHWSQQQLFLLWDQDYRAQVADGIGT